MALKDKWIPQDKTMDASPNIPNMLADAIIQNETSINTIRTISNSATKRLDVAEPKILNLESKVTQHENDIKELQENGGSGGSESDVFIVQFDSLTKTADKSYNEILEATEQHKVVMLYEGERYLASLNGFVLGGADLLFETHDIYNIMSVTEYKCTPFNEWTVIEHRIVTDNYLTGFVITAENPGFVSAVIASLPDADTMSFPLKETVSEVSEE